MLLTPLCPMSCLRVPPQATYTPRPPPPPPAMPSARLKCGTSTKRGSRLRRLAAHISRSADPGKSVLCTHVLPAHARDTQAAVARVRCRPPSTMSTEDRRYRPRPHCGHLPAPPSSAQPRRRPPLPPAAHSELIPAMLPAAIIIFDLDSQAHMLLVRLAILTLYSAERSTIPGLGQRIECNAGRARRRRCGRIPSRRSLTAASRLSTCIADAVPSVHRLMQRLTCKVVFQRKLSRRCSPAVGAPAPVSNCVR